MVRVWTKFLDAPGESLVSFPMRHDFLVFLFLVCLGCSDAIHAGAEISDQTQTGLPVSPLALTPLHHPLFSFPLCQRWRFSFTLDALRVHVQRVKAYGFLA